MLYLDSSVLIKHYQDEDGSEALERKLKVERESSRSVFTSVLTYVEIHAIMLDGGESSRSPQKKLKSSMIVSIRIGYSS